MTSFADKVRAAANPQAALLTVAEGIDTILDVLEQNGPAAPAASPWGEWTLPEPSAQPIKRAPVAVDNSAQIAAVQAQLDVETDGENRLALEARLRLLKDDGQSVEVGVPAGNRETYEGTEEVGVVTIPPATPERQATRIAMARANNLAEYGTLGSEDFYAAYGKGGPMWLYAGNRDGVMQMPFELRRALVEDVALDSDAAAQEMGRDILKDRGTGNSAPMAQALDVEHAL